MAHTKAKGSTKLGRDSRGQRLGVKLFGGQPARPGMILVRQRGSKWYAGEGTKVGRDDTIYAMREGVVKFYQKTVRNFDGSLKKKTFVGLS